MFLVGLGRCRARSPPALATLASPRARVAARPRSRGTDRPRRPSEERDDRATGVGGALRGGRRRRGPLGRRCPLGGALPPLDRRCSTCAGTGARRAPPGSGADRGAPPPGCRGRLPLRPRARRARVRGRLRGRIVRGRPWPRGGTVAGASGPATRSFGRAAVGGHAGACRGGRLRPLRRTCAARRGSARRAGPGPGAVARLGDRPPARRPRAARLTARPTPDRR
jgi:hypothetical protein